jgi:hypothetical protein
MDLSCSIPDMSLRRGSGITAAISILATIAIFGSQQVPVVAAVKAAAPVAAGVPLASSAPSSYRRIAPSFRILDTRTGLCGGNVCHALGAGQSLTLQITGYVDPATSQTVPSGATAVVLNVTAINGSSFSLLTVYPTGTSPVPTASNLNFPAHTALANSVTAQIGTGGAVNIYNALGAVNVAADVEGYFTPASATLPAGEYHPIAPIRVCDTRAGQPATTCNGLNDGKPHMLGPNSSIKVQIAGTPAYCSTSPCPPGDFIPTDGTEENAIVNLTAIGGASNTFLSIVPFTTTGCQFGGNKGAPSYSDVNVNAGGVQANRVFVPLGTGATPLNICVYNAAGKANFIIDADGWFGGTGPPPTPTGLQYVATSPTRICDTRSGNSTQCSGHILTAGSARLVTAGGVDGISSSAQAIIANLTAVAGSSFTFLSAYPSGTTRPNVSDVNVSAGQVLPNLTAITLGGSPGSFNLYNALGNINAIVDVEGWFQ